MKVEPRRVLMSLAAAGALAFVGPTLAHAQSPATGLSGSQIELRQSDGDLVAVDEETAFIRSAIADAATELQAARLAEARAGDPTVRQFASVLARQYQTILDDANEVADQYGVGARQAPTDEGEEALIGDLESRTGKDFDETFMRAFVQDQRVTLDNYMQVRDDLDGEVAEFADRHVGNLSQQLRAGIELSQRLGIEIEEN